MILIGKVTGGMVVLPPEARLADGAVVEVRPVGAGKTGRELAAVWAASPRLPADEAESFARDIETSRERLNHPPAARDWE